MPQKASPADATGKRSARGGKRTRMKSAIDAPAQDGESQRVGIAGGIAGDRNR